MNRLQTLGVYLLASCFAMLQSAHRQMSQPAGLITPIEMVRADGQHDFDFEIGRMWEVNWVADDTRESKNHPPGE
jgi:hypothetical protein